MESRTPICENGKSFLINPNLLFGQGLDDGITVAHEDLNIYVELTTSKKNRSIIDVSDNGLEYTSSDVGKSRVSFIDGSPNGEFDGKNNEKTSLTTSYTDLTTVFNKTADTEKFGMTSIDIDFNSAYAPLVHIEFVDVRGASLFNTDMGDGKGPQSEYSSFFDLPYPIFQLKVKGYYGKTVKYCLHLTKWNARFNTQTGNFEISADFIGYTYAMLSDLLLGYLRAITYTPMGAAKFVEAQAEMHNPSELITIKDLLDKIIDVNENIVKLQDNDDDVKELSKNKEIQAAIDGVENLLFDGIKDLLDADDSSLKGYAMLDSGDGLIGVRNLKEDKEQSKINADDLQTWKDAMKAQVDELNNNIVPEKKFDISDFAGEKVPLYYENFIYDEIVTGTTTTNQKQNDFRNAWGLTDEKDYSELMETRMASVVKNVDNRKINITLYDFSKTMKTISDIKAKISENEEQVKTAVALKIKQTFVDILGFEPTIGTIFRIFTVHAEIFLECLKEVSQKAELDTDGLRMVQLVGLRDDLDIHKDFPKRIYPWPLFRTVSTDKNKGGVLEEAYLGDTKNGGVKIPQNVPELVFVDELLVALIQVAKDDAARQERIDNPNTIVDSWYPVNVLDTPLFGVIQNPYKTPAIGDSNNPLDPLKLMLMRAFVFLGVSNRGLYGIPVDENPKNTDEVKLMAILEANTCNEGVLDKKIKLAMIDASLSDTDNADNIIKWFLDGKKGDRNVSFKLGDEKVDYNLPRPLFAKEVNGNYAYVYISKIPSTSKIFYKNGISFNGNFDGSEFFDKDGVRVSDSTTLSNSYWKKPEGGHLFVEANYTDKNNSPETGAILMKIFTEEYYEKQTKSLTPQYVEQVDSIKEMIASVKAAQSDFLDSGQMYDTKRNEEDIPEGFNIFGDATSRFAFTTVSQVDISNHENMSNAEGDEKAIPNVTPTPGTAPLKCIFYVNQGSKFGATSLSKPPIGGSSELEKEKHKGIGGKYFYDIRYKDTGAREFSKSAGAPRYPDLGKNRDLFNDEQLFIPHIDFIVTNRDTENINVLGDNVYNVYSLFGSQWYFEQRRSSSPKAAKAYLFLHTFPWNQLYTDNSASNGRMAGIFDNNEGHTISNLFDRKSAFLNVPYLWAAFIGGALWRYNTNDIIYNTDTASDGDPSGKIPTFEGGSGKFDPIVWGVRRYTESVDSSIIKDKCFLYDYVVAHNDKTYLERGLFPKRDQWLTSWTADGPLELDTDGEYKFISDTLLTLPLQIKKEFRRIFLEFVESNEWRYVREAYEMKPSQLSPNSGDWNLPNNISSTVWNVSGYNNGY